MLRFLTITHKESATLTVCESVVPSDGTEPERADEEKIKSDVANASNGDEIHGAFAVAHAPKNGGENIICRDKRNAEEADGEIRNGGCDRLRRRRHDGCDRAHRKKQKPHEHNGKAHKQRDGIPDALGGSFSVPRADGVCNADGCSHGKPDDHDREHVHNLRPDGDGGGIGNACELPDDEQIRHAVERLQKIGEKIRQ